MEIEAVLETARRVRTEQLYGRILKHSELVAQLKRYEYEHIFEVWKWDKESLSNSSLYEIFRAFNLFKM